MLRKELAIIQGDQDPARYAKSREGLVAARERMQTEYENKLAYLDERIADLDSRHNNGPELIAGIEAQLGMLRDRQLGPTFAKLREVQRKMKELGMEVDLAKLETLKEAAE